jgi:hypothetical protein
MNRHSADDRNGNADDCSHARCVCVSTGIVVAVRRPGRRFQQALSNSRQTGTLPCRCASPEELADVTTDRG